MRGCVRWGNDAHHACQTMPFVLTVEGRAHLVDQCQLGCAVGVKQVLHRRLRGRGGVGAGGSAPDGAVRATADWFGVAVPAGRLRHGAVHPTRAFARKRPGQARPGQAAGRGVPTGLRAPLSRSGAAVRPAQARNAFSMSAASPLSVIMLSAVLPAWLVHARCQWDGVGGQKRRVPHSVGGPPCARWARVRAGVGLDRRCACRSARTPATLGTARQFRREHVEACSVRRVETAGKKSAAARPRELQNMGAGCTHLVLQEQVRKLLRHWDVGANEVEHGTERGGITAGGRGQQRRVARLVGRAGSEGPQVVSERGRAQAVVCVCVYCTWANCTWAGVRACRASQHCGARGCVQAREVGAWVECCACMICACRPCRR